MTSAIATPAAPRPRASLASRFNAKVDRSAGPDGCHLWTAGRAAGGYGQIRVGVVEGKSVFARSHRVAYELAYGPIPAGSLCTHECDVRVCTNPKHLSLGTHRANMSQAADRKRMAHGDAHHSRSRPEVMARGEKNGQARLTEGQVLEIRALFAAGGVTLTALAVRFGGPARPSPTPSPAGRGRTCPSSSAESPPSGPPVARGGPLAP